MNGDLAPIVGDSRVIREAVALARKVAPTTLPVLLVGPTGCGKELFAQWIHRWSGRPGEPVDVNCAALPESLAESELFGHGAEAFTGARRSLPGLIEAADRGSLFLDEVASLSASVQAKLLRVVETNETRRVGETRKRHVEVRYIAAAQDDLLTREAGWAFRDDLYHRLAGALIRIPALAGRPEDILPLACYFAERLGRVVQPGAEQSLLEHPWPGNVRELRMAIDRAACLDGDGTLSATIVAQAIALGASGGPPADAPSRAQLLAVCRDSGFDPVRIMTALGVGRSAMYDRLRAAGLRLRALRKSGLSTGRPADFPDNSIEPFLHELVTR